MQPIIADAHGDRDPLTRPNPVYETLTNHLVSHVRKAAVTDQPQGSEPSSNHSLSPPLIETPPPPTLDSSILDTGTNNIIDAGATLREVSPKPRTIDANQECTVLTPASQSRVYPTTPSQLIGHESTQPAQGLTQGSVADMLPRRSYSFGYHANGVSRPLENVHSYLYFTIVAAIVVSLCLDFVVLLSCFLPALWFANKVRALCS